MRPALLTWRHAEWSLVKGSSWCHIHLSLSSSSLGECKLPPNSGICYLPPDCSLLLPEMALSGRHLRISLPPTSAANSKRFNRGFLSSYWDSYNGWVTNSEPGIKIETWSSISSRLFTYLFHENMHSLSTMHRLRRTTRLKTKVKSSSIKTLSITNNHPVICLARRRFRFPPLFFFCSTIHQVPVLPSFLSSFLGPNIHLLWAFACVEIQLTRWAEPGLALRF